MTTTSMHPEPEQKPAASPFRGANAGYLPVAGALLGFGGGYLLDRANGTLPWWTISLGVVMTAIGFYHLMKEFRQ